MNKLALILVASLFSNSVLAWGSCKYEREIEREVSLGEAQKIEVDAGAGSLEIEGEDRDSIMIRARLCSDDEEALAKMDVAFAVESNAAYLRTEFPEKAWLSGADRQAKIDLILAVPDNLPMSVADSSGEASVKKVASLKMVDSSGELMIKEVAGDLAVVDSSGELTIKDIGGDAQVTDSSGAIIIKNVQGGVVIEADSSGGIAIDNVKQNVLIKRDSSGGISVSSVGGDFSVNADTSGGIDYDDVAGKVSLPN